MLISLGTTNVTPLSTATSGATGTVGTGITTGISGTASTQTAQTGSVGTSVTTGTGSTVVTTLTGSTSQAVSRTTSKTCKVMQAVDEAVSKKITVTPNELPKGVNIEFQPTSKQGVSFDQNDRTPTITVQFDKPAEVRSVTIPRDKTPNGNVQQFEVTFYSPAGKKLNDKPILSNASPKDDKSQPAKLDSTQIPSDTPVSRLEITIVATTDDESPKGVVLDINACTEAGTG